MSGASILSGDKRALLERLRRERGHAEQAQTIARRTDAGPAPMSLAQRRLWTIEAGLEVGARHPYVRVFAFEIRGELDPELLRRSLEVVVGRHEAWRTAFEMAGGEALQRVVPRIAVELPVIDLSALPASDRRAELERRIAAVDRRFDLRRPPLFRLSLCRLGSAEHALIAVLHHIIYDGRSIDVLIAELGLAYRALEAGRSPELPSLPIQLGDYAAWERRRREDPDFAGHLAYWEAQLRGAPTSLDLLPDGPRPGRQSYRGASACVPLSRDLLGGLRALSQATGETLYTISLAAFAVLLGRQSGQRDLIVGMTSLGRPHPELRGLLGYFVDMLPIRVDLEGSPSFGELVSRVGGAIRGAMEHDVVPFEDIVRQTRPPYDPSRPALCQVDLSLQRAGDLGSVGAASVGYLEIGDGVSAFELSLDLREVGDELEGTFEYAADLFDPARIERMAAHVATLFSAAVRAPETPIDDLPMVPPAERRWLIHDLNETAVARPFVAVHERFRGWAERTPDAIALRFEGSGLSYRELDERSDALAERLLAVGMGRGAVVALLLERSVELVVAVLATLKVGAAFLPIDPEYPDARVAMLVRDARAEGVLTSRVLSARAAAVTGVRCLSLDDGSVPLRPSGPPPTIAVGEADAFCVLYTSGSTGTPKGVINTHGGMHNRLLWSQAAMPMGPEDAYVFKSPSTFDGIVPEILSPLIAGARIVVARPGGHRELAYLAELIESEAVTFAFFVPSILKAFLADLGTGRCRSLRWIVVGGEALTPTLLDEVRRKLGASLGNDYGPTEASVGVGWWPSPERSVKVVPIGRPIHNTALYVLDDHLEPAPTGVAGELFIAGVGLARGYLGRAGLTAARFVPCPFLSGERMYRTGDVARVLASGEIEFLGRDDDQIKLRGVRIELGEIEAALLAMPTLQDAVVVAQDDARGGPRLVAYVVPLREAFAETAWWPGGDECVVLDPASAGPESAATLAALPDDVRRWLRARLPAQLVPSEVCPVSRFPLTTSGKTDRKRLPPLAPRPSAISRRPATAAERLVTEMWSTLLGVASVGLDDNFFDLGGHSLLAAQLTARLGAELQVEIPMGALFLSPTPEGLLAVLTELFGDRETLEGAASLLLDE